MLLHKNSPVGPSNSKQTSWLSCRHNRNANTRCGWQTASHSKHDAFTSWFQDQCTTPLPVLLHPKAIEGADGVVGMFTETGVNKGDTLVRVPKALLMSAESAATSPSCQALVRLEGITPWQALCLHLLCERALGTASFWHPYIATLPDQLGHPLLWGEEQWAWLEGSPLLGRLQERRQQVAEDVETLELAGANELPLALQHQQEHQAALVSEESISWAAATILSRSFSLDFKGEEEGGGLEEDDQGADDMGEGGPWGSQPEPSICLVPWADLLNHSSEAGPESILRYDAQQGAATLAAHVEYAAGAQVFDSYGQLLSPGELLLDYGYSESPSANDRLDILASSVIAKPRGQRNRNLLAALEKLQGGASLLSLQPDGPDQGSLTVLRAALATDSELIRGGWRVKATAASIDDAARALGRLSDPVSEATEVAVLDALEAFCLRQLGEYPSSLQQDEEALSSGAQPWLQQQAVKAVMSEKRALLGSLDAIQVWRGRLQEGVPLDELYSAGVEGWDEGEYDEEEEEEDASR